jgi:hypothetical protein
MLSIKEFLTESVIERQEVLSDWDTHKFVDNAQTVTVNLEHLYKPLNVSAMQVKGDRMVFPIKVPHTCDILDCIEGINCDIWLEVNGIQISINDRTLVPVAALQFTEVVIKASMPLDNLPERFGFRARCTLLDKESRIRLATSDMKIDCGDYFAYKGLSGICLEANA